MIPKIIWQTYKTPYPAKQSVSYSKTWIEQNPDYKWYYFDDAKCQQFIQDHFDDEFYQMYCSLPIGVMKSDVWRIAVIYVYGGVYADLDTRCLVPINEWIRDTDRLVVGVETPHGALANYVFAAEPKHPAVYSALKTLVELYNSPNYLNKNSPTPIQDFGANAWSHGILRHYGLDNLVAMEQGGAYYNSIEQVQQEGTRFYLYSNNPCHIKSNEKTLVEHHVASQSWNLNNYDSWRIEESKLFKAPAKNTKFVTTFSKNGYQVYGHHWIESFLNCTKQYPNITACVYVEGMDVDKLDYGPRVEIIDFDQAFPNHSNWVKMFKKESIHDSWNKNLSIKFSFKSFVIIDSLKNNNGYVIWLDADCIFISENFDAFAKQALDGNFVACQKEADTTHIESGIVIFDADHPDRQKFIDVFERYYSDPNEFNAFGQFFDGFALRRAIENTNVSCIDLNKNHGRGGIQSDPSCTFLNPVLATRFQHNIGITGKRKYENWKDYAKVDPMFQLIHGANELTLEDKLEKIKTKISTLRKF